MKWALFLFLALLISITAVSAASYNFDTDLTSEEQAELDEALEPLMKLIRYAQYIGGFVCLLMFVYGGILFITSGGELEQRRRAKKFLEQ